MADEDDEVLHEIDVYLAKGLAENLYLFQYPVRPSHVPYDEVTHLAARIKPQQHKVELELSINTKSPNYAHSKGEQIALNVDGCGASSSKEAPLYSSDVMDKQVLVGSGSSIATARYAAALLKHGELHITPLQGIVQLLPSFGYLDRVDSRHKAQADNEDEQSQDEGEEDVKPVMVRYARPESAEAKARRMASYEYLHKQQEGEAWIHTQYHQQQDDHAVGERLQLFCRQSGEVTAFPATPQDYLKLLMPPPDEELDIKPDLPSNVLSLSQLKNMTLSDQIKSLLTNTKLIRFGQLMSLLPKGTDSVSALRLLQQVAMLVQGCWIVKSDVLYPKDSCSAHSGVPADMLCRGRDFVMWKFTQSRFVIRKDVSSVVKLPAEDVKDILEQMARVKVNQGWEFLLPFDSDFIDRHPEVVQRQQMLWDAKNQQLSKLLKTAKGAAEPQAVPEKPKRRRTTSRSRTKSGGERSMSDQSDTDMEKMDVDPALKKDSTLNHVSNGTQLDLSNNDNSEPTPSLELKMELVNFVQEKLYSRYILTLSDLKRLFALKLAQCPPGHVLGTGVSDRLLEKTVIEVGGTRLQTQWPPGVKEEPVYALVKTGDKFDNASASLTITSRIRDWYRPPSIVGVKRLIGLALVYYVNRMKSGDFITKLVRTAMLDLFRSSFRLKSSSLRKKLEDAEEEVPSENDCKKILKDYCITKGGLWYLKGTCNFDS